MIIQHEGQTYDITPICFNVTAQFGSPLEYEIRGYSNDCFYISPGEKKKQNKKKPKGLFVPDKVIFNAPATVVYWTDGTKTVVKCQPGDTFDPLMGFLLAVFKKACGNKSNYNNALKKIVPGYGKEAQDAAEAG